MLITESVCDVFEGFPPQAFQFFTQDNMFSLLPFHQNGGSDKQGEYSEIPRSPSTGVGEIPSTYVDRNARTQILT